MPKSEIWQIVPSYPWILASTHGRVMIVPKLGTMPHGGARHYGSRARKGCWDGTRYILQHDKKTYKVARLVCEAFNGPPPFKGAVCMHVDENSRNNRPENLRWGSQKENLNAPGFLDYCRGRTGENSPIIKGLRRRAA